MSTQRGKRSRNEIDLDDYEPEESNETLQRVKSMPSATDWDEEEIQRKIKDIVRYCISCEYKRKIIRREDIQKHLQAKGSSYNNILASVRRRLKEVFGYDLVELASSSVKQNQSKTQQQQQQQGGDEDEEEGTQTQVPSTQAAKKGVATGTYVLVSALKEDYNTPEIITRSTEEYQYTGILYVILGLIFLNANEISSTELYSHLDRMKIRKNSKNDLEDRDKILDHFIKHAYLRKAKKPDTDAEELEYIFTAGPRAKAELPMASLVHFMCSFYRIPDEEKETLARKMYIQAGFTDNTR